MGDIVSAAERSRIMAMVPSQNSSPEVAVRRALHAAGFRFRLHGKHLPGKPDIVLPRYKTVVFVHGCLWHWHGCKRSRMPASNASYWTRKIEGNVRRDTENADALRGAGWSVEVVWECELPEGAEALIRRLGSTKLARKVPRPLGCGSCDITKEDCSQRAVRAL
jgi:DNA mismatch endonuclease (patch repair protein)